MVRANVVGIAPHVGGPSSRLNVVDNQEVHEGDVLFVVDPRPFEIALERPARRAHAGRRARWRPREGDRVGHRRGRPPGGGARVRPRLRRRLEPLLPKTFVTRDRYDEATVKARAADAGVERARRDLDRQRKLLAQFGDVNAHVAAARAAVRAAELDLRVLHGARAVRRPASPT